MILILNIASNKKAPIYKYNKSYHVELTVLAVNPIKSLWTFTNISYECVASVRFTNFTYPTIMTWIRKAGSWERGEKEEAYIHTL